MICFDNVTKVFGDEKVALDKINFTVNSGEFVFVTGHSGSGKTTLLRLLLREYRPTSGSIIFDDQDLGRLSRRKVARHRQKVGVVFQDCKMLDDLTIWENIALPLIIARQSRQEIDTRITELLKMLNLEGRANDFPSQLSGGEAQRACLARALSVAPKVIFADEPTGNLDDDNGETIVKLLRAINKYGTTVIFATHNLRFIDENPSARHLKIDHGRLIYDSSPTAAPAAFAPESDSDESDSGASDATEESAAAEEPVAATNPDEAAATTDDTDDDSPPAAAAKPKTATRRHAVVEDLDNHDADDDDGDSTIIDDDVADDFIKPLTDQKKKKFPWLHRQKKSPSTASQKSRLKTKKSKEKE